MLSQDDEIWRLGRIDLLFSQMMIDFAGIAQDRRLAFFANLSSENYTESWIGYCREVFRKFCPYTHLHPAIRTDLVWINSWPCSAQRFDTAHLFAGMSKALRAIASKLKRMLCLNIGVNRLNWNVLFPREIILVAQCQGWEAAALINENVISSRVPVFVNSVSTCNAIPIR